MQQPDIDAHIAVDSGDGVCGSDGEARKPNLESYATCRICGIEGEISLNFSHLRDKSGTSSLYYCCDAIGGEGISCWDKAKKDQIVRINEGL